MMRRTLAGLTAVMAILSLGEAKATLITYTETATALRKPGRDEVHDALVTITGTADTNNVVCRPLMSSTSRSPRLG